MNKKLFCLAAAGLIWTGAAMGLAPEAEAANADAAKSSAEHQGQKATADGGWMPSPDEYTGLSRKVLEYSKAFDEIIETAKESELTEADWEPLEKLVDTEDYERMGVFLGDEAEIIDWQKYKKYISQYAAHTSWDGKLRRITEVPGLVILELEEHNTVNGVTDISNTVTIYEFNDDGKIDHLDVYVMPLP